MNDYPKDGLLWLSGWFGISKQPVVVVGETPKKYRIRAIEQTKLGGRCRWLETGETTLVPKRAITFEMEKAG